MTERLTDDEQGSFIPGRGCIDQIFNLEKKGEKAWEKKHNVYVGFTDLENVFDKVKREAIWQALGMYDVGAKLQNVFRYIC